MKRRYSALALSVALAESLVAPRADAARRRRITTFEPTDLSVQEPGHMELDTQFGAALHNEEPLHALYAPDFELNLGVMKRVELDVDGAFLMPLGAPGPWHSDDTWVSLKVGLGTLRAEADPSERLSFGMQLGPRLPTSPQSQGLGYGAMFLAGYTRRTWTLTANVGGTAETPESLAAKRALHTDLGLDGTLALNHRATWSLLSEVGGSVFYGADPNDLHVTVGVQSSAWAFADLSVVGYVGLLSAGDRAALLLGFNPHFQLWK